jgi:AraC-like DNA-binding protein
LAVINYMAALHGLILALVIGRKSLQRFDANTLLALLLGISSYGLAVSTLYNGGFYEIWPHLLILFDPLIMLVPPLIYLYVHSRIAGHIHWRPIHFAHLIPFFLNGVLWLPFYLMNSHDKVRFYLENLQHPKLLSLVMLPRILVAFAYIFASLAALVSHTRSLAKAPGDAHRKNLSWLWHLLVGVLFVWGTISLLHLYIPTRISEEELNHLSNLLSSAFIFAMGYRVLLHPEILHREMAPQEPVKYQKTGLGDEEAEEIWRRLERVMAQEQPHLNGKLTLQGLADQLLLPGHQLSQVINQKGAANFNSYLNGHRIRAAQEMMRSHPDQKLLAIAFACGFSSLSTFNRVFRETTGQSPSEYRETERRA